MRKEAFLGTPLGPVWEKIGIHPHHGINVPVSALRSKEGLGIGDFGDLCLLGKWCKEIGFDTIQILPVNDCGDDPSPYNGLSSIALNPVYLNLETLPGFAEPLDELRDLNKLDRVHFHEVARVKEELLRKYFAKEFTHIFLSDNFQKFVVKQPWLAPYAMFKVLKKEQGGKNWTDWPVGLREIGETKFKELSEEYNQEMVYHFFLQYLCHQQLKATRKYLNGQGVKLMGDLPILVSPDSADVWWYHKLFDLAYSAGVPPDIFNEKGQCWGFPIYNWREFENSDFAWWKQRLQVASDYYDMYRLDHVLGFFHLWTIPRGKTAAEGFFTPERGPLGFSHGKEILETLVNASSMLPIGEDLGAIACDKIFHILQKMGIPGTRWIRFEKTWEGDEHYIPLKKYHPVNMTTVSTHDSEPLAMWWKEFPEEVKKYCAANNFPYAKTLTPEMRFDLLRAAHTSPTIFHINLLQEYLALFPDEFCWGKPEEERINEPGTVKPSNWTYRIKPFTEDFIKHKGLKKKMQELSA